jgi:hypothetical protein
VNRLIVPILSMPQPVNETGLGDIQYQRYISPANPGSFVWGVGPSLRLHTAGKETLGSEKWSIGPGVVALVTTGPWVVRGLLDNVWSSAGND